MDISEWTGPVGDAWADEWRRTDRSFAGLAPPLDAAIAAAVPAEGIAIDIGCGAGTTSLALAAARPALRVVGLDVSPALVAVARDRAGGHTNLSFEQGTADAAAERFAPVDVFCSRHGVMFFPDPAAAFAALAGAAAPGARLVFSCFRGAALNPWASELAAVAAGAPPPPPPAGYVPSPFAFADPGFVAPLLASAGWRDIRHEPVDFAYVAGAGDDPVGDALDFFLRIGPTAAILRRAEGAARAAMIERIAALLERRRTGATVSFPAAAWLWSARAG